jgi:hypothetical protein
MDSSETCTHIRFAGILTGEGDLCWCGCPLVGAYSAYYLRSGHHDACRLQAVRDVRASHNTLLDLFDRIEGFFRRLETYTEVPLTPEMMGITVKIMVEVLSILGIATKEIKQGRTSE